ncbi:flagellar biosynthesis anti-sigma factor FlgM [Paenibacillus antarcticus]|uniref:Negative regulator of flagellin synthesis n=1 Tax=Paenibacillus antarcticus TaxID=253703 RepID=A0A168QER9_9BACL|nr:flagellar biosynthesis anti-sigma factor FlgM [Paenibacillus antarcticus]OAB47704.1 flagellar biosynthesis anti-sigma factor FlgM [Paenibacillus antarcticus]
MKINETGRVGAINSYQRNIESGHKTEEKRSRRKDEVSISAEAMEMLQANERSANSERTQQVQDLKQQVASGTYQVDSKKLAEKLLPYFKQFPEN